MKTKEEQEIPLEGAPLKIAAVLSYATVIETKTAD